MLKNTKIDLSSSKNWRVNVSLQSHPLANSRIDQKISKKNRISPKRKYIYFLNDSKNVEKCLKQQKSGSKCTLNCRENFEKQITGEQDFWKICWKCIKISNRLIVCQIVKKLAQNFQKIRKNMSSRFKFVKILLKLYDG